MRVRNLEFFKLGNCSLSRNSGFASMSFFSSTSIIALADFVSPYLESCSFSLERQKMPYIRRSFIILTRIVHGNKNISYRKFSKIKSCVISLNNSSLKDAKTFKSFTSISTAFARSCLQQRNSISLSHK